MPHFCSPGRSGGGRGGGGSGRGGGGGRGGGNGTAGFFGAGVGHTRVPGNGAQANGGGNGSGNARNGGGAGGPTGGAAWGRPAASLYSRHPATPAASQVPRRMRRGAPEPKKKNKNKKNKGAGNAKGLPVAPAGLAALPSLTGGKALVDYTSD